MIRVTVELVSAIAPERNRVLGVALLTNDGETSWATGGRLGDYRVTLSKWAPKLTETWKQGTIAAFDRKKRGPWDLLFLALRATVGSRNPTEGD
jgi:hypothetical protein